MVYGECLSCLPWIPIILNSQLHPIPSTIKKAPWHHKEKVQSIAKLRTFPQYRRTQLQPGKGSKIILGHVHHFGSLKSRVDVPNSRGGQSQTSCVNHTETAPSSSWKGATAPPSRDWPRDKTFRPFSGAKSWSKHLRFSNNPDFRCLTLLGHLFQSQSPYIIFSHILFGGPKKTQGHCLATEPGTCFRKEIFILKAQAAWTCSVSEDREIWKEKRQLQICCSNGAKASWGRFRNGSNMVQLSLIANNRGANIQMAQLRVPLVCNSWGN